ncbi:hypothetical protein HY407_00285 [Candidatus Gottesmanbacteria bacterium]|nr:hypothetical protein [Candidatus Gottesmanbacteria bacterium]
MVGITAELSLARGNVLERSNGNLNKGVLVKRPTFIKDLIRLDILATPGTPLLILGPRGIGKTTTLQHAEPNSLTPALYYLDGNGLKDEVIRAHLRSFIPKNTCYSRGGFVVIDHFYKEEGTYVDRADSLFKDGILQRLHESRYRVVLTGSRRKWEDKYRRTNGVLNFVGLDSGETGWQLQAYQFGDDIIGRIQKKGEGNASFNIFVAAALSRTGDLEFAFKFARKKMEDRSCNPYISWEAYIQEKLQELPFRQYPI